MKKTGILLVALFILVLFSGCTEKINDSEITCNAPYILVGQDCCLDANSNSICDADEQEKNVTFECKFESDCNDNDETTADSCELGKCRHTSITSVSEPEPEPAPTGKWCEATETQFTGTYIEIKDFAIGAANFYRDPLTNKDYIYRDQNGYASLLLYIPNGSEIKNVVGDFSVIGTDGKVFYSDRYTFGDFEYTKPHLVSTYYSDVQYPDEGEFTYQAKITYEIKGESFTTCSPERKSYTSPEKLKVIVKLTETENIASGRPGIVAFNIKGTYTSEISGFNPFSETKLWVAYMPGRINIEGITFYDYWEKIYQSAGELTDIKCTGNDCSFKAYLGVEKKYICNEDSLLYISIYANNNFEYYGENLFLTKEDLPVLCS